MFFPSHLRARVSSVKTNPEPDEIDASAAGPMQGSGLLVACKFGCEDAAVREVQRALGGSMVKKYPCPRQLPRWRMETRATEAATPPRRARDDRCRSRNTRGASPSRTRARVAQYDGTSQKHSPGTTKRVKWPTLARTRWRPSRRWSGVATYPRPRSNLASTSSRCLPASATEEALEAAVAAECDAAVRDPSSR